MPQVPYSGAPTVAPQLDPTPRYTADVTPDMFGANIGRAVQQLGATSEQVGNEIFARGLAMQDLANHSEAQQGIADLMGKVGDIHAKLTSLKGKDAVDYFNGDYKPDLQKAYQDIGSTMSNPMSQKLYQGEGLSTLGRTIFNGAGHSGQELKNYAVQSSQSKVQATHDQVLANPLDSDGFKAALASNEAEIRSQIAIKFGGGGNDATADEAVAQNRSALYSDKIKGMLKGPQAITAGREFDKAVKEGNIRGDDIGRMQNMVDQARHTIGARVASMEVSSGANGRWGQGPVDIKSAATAIGQIESGGNYDAKGVSTAHGQALGKYQVMEEFLPEFLKKAGLPEMTPAEFLKNHSAQDQVFEANFGAYMKQTGSANDAASMWLTGKPLAEAGGVKDAYGTDAKTYVNRFNGALAQNAGMSDRVAMGEKIAAEHAPDDPLFPDYVRQRIEGDYRQDIAMKRDDRWQTEQPIEAAITGGMLDGQRPTGPDDLRKDPKVAAAWDKLVETYPEKARFYMNIMARTAKGDYLDGTPEAEKAWSKFIGMASMPDTKGDFVDDSTTKAIMEAPFSWKRKSELIDMQWKMRGKNDQENPQIVSALRILGPDMIAAGIDGKDKDQKAQFVGELADQLRQFSQDNARPPKFEEVRTMGSRLLQNVKTPTWYGTTDTPIYQVPIPPDMLAAAKAADPNLTDWEAQRRYTAALYKEKFGKAPKAATPSPSPPVSQ